MTWLSCGKFIHDSRIVYFRELGETEATVGLAEESDNLDICFDYGSKMHRRRVPTRFLQSEYELSASESNLVLQFS